jgi:autotransporter-associated beta strand protein
MKKLLLLAFIFASVTTSAQTYINGCGNWTNTYRNSSGCFGFTGGIGMFSFGTTTQGDLNGRFITVDGSLAGTPVTLNPGQKIVMRIAGQTASGRAGIITDGIIGFSLRSTTNLFDGGTDLDPRYNNNALTKVEFRGGDGNARYNTANGLVYGNMPDFNTFKSGVTYEIEVISDKEFNLVIGGTRNNIEPFANGGGSIRQIQVRNSGANMDGQFTNLVVSNLPINLTSNTGETKTVTGVMSDNGANVNTVNKNGVGTVDLTGQNTFTGLTSVNAGTLRLNRTGGATLPSNNDVTVTSGATLRVSTNQTLNNLTLPAGASLTVDSGATLTINGTFTYSGTISGTGTIAYGATGTLVYGLTGSQTTAAEWPSASGPSSVTINSGSYTLNSSKSLSEDLILSTGTALTVPSAMNITVGDDLINNGGTVTIENNANLIQNGTTNDNVGDVTVFRNSASLFKLDYTLWSAPVAGQNLLAFSPSTLPNRFYTYDSGTDDYSPIVPSTNDFEEGIGYLIRMPDNHPTATATIWNGSFTGLPNNGNVSVSVANDTYNAVGNPYPSTLDADDFINTNGITEALYFWRKTNNAVTSSYATYTLAGGVGTGSNSGDPLGLVPNGVIQVGQGFIVKSTSTSINFDNTMRIGDNANQFFRNSSEIENNRIRLTAIGDNGFYSQLLVNYRTDATNDFDATLDGRFINDSENAFYTQLNQEPFVIQARALPFENTDVVSLGFKTDAAGTFSIVLNEKDGVFADNSEIYIKDNTLGIWHPIAESPYEFVSEAGTFSERFELVYQEALSVNEPLVNANSFIVVKENNSLTVQSAQEEIATVYVYDLSGRLIASSINNASTSVVIPLENTQTQVLLLQVITQKGITSTKKVVY